MADGQKVTVDKAYFDALLRRADFHTSSQGLDHLDPSNILISRVEYDNLLRTLHEYDALKNALFQGGITAETLDILTSGIQGKEARKDSGCAGQWADDTEDPYPSYDSAQKPSFTPMQYDNFGPGRHSFTPAYNAPPKQANHNATTGRARYSNTATPNLSQQISYALTDSFEPDDSPLDVDKTFGDGYHPNGYANGKGQSDSKSNNAPLRTLYFTGFSDRTTYKDLMAVIRYGKVLSVNLRRDRTATVSFMSGASEFLSWAKRNDIYLQSKRIEVTAADRQFHINKHIEGKVQDGASRNLLIHGATRNGLTEEQIRDDMEHIHNLVIIDIQYRGMDAYVSTNSVHNALFARTCMMSRRTYKGCKIEFYRDECDSPPPVREYKPNPVPQQSTLKRTDTLNRFDLLDLYRRETASDEENQPPSDTLSEEEHGVKIDLA